MTRDDIILMAQEANRYANDKTGDSYEWHFIRVERFAALVAAAEREAVMAVVNDNTDGDGLCCADDLLAAIRARGREMIWPSRGEPLLYQRGKWWIVRWYDPVSKQCRAVRTKSEVYAKALHNMMR